MKLTKLQREYCIANGFIKIKGILINTTALNTDYDEFFVPDECLKDYYEKCSKWIDILVAEGKIKIEDFGNKKLVWINVN